MAVASWVIIDKETGKAVMETFNQKTADAVNTEKFDVMPIKDYLYALNERIKNGNCG